MHASQLLCPRCQRALYVGEAHPSTMWGCGHCGGVWLDNATAERVVKTACQVSLALAKAAADNVRADVKPPHHPVGCPVCHRAMRAQRVASAWLDIDVCDAHGTWYDRGELERVARTAHVAPGDWRTGPAVPAAAVAATAAERVGASTFDHTDTAELAVEGTFALVDLLSALFD